MVEAGPSQIAERVLHALEAADASVAGLPQGRGCCAGGAGVERRGAGGAGTADCPAVP